ncbi:MAG TPA: hypothetical protein VLB86_16605 [Gaiellaceae bacterium]|nr:hypothetical protein [Gaiellaceae bacterium]
MLVAVAVDALRAPDRPAAPAPARDLAGDRAVFAAQLRRAGIRGTLVYTNATCELLARRLPDLRPVAPPPGLSRSCPFALRPDGTTVAPGDAAWSSDGRWAACAGSSTAVFAALDLRPGLVVPGCAPAWRPAAPPSLTLVRDGGLVEVDPACRGRSCGRVLLSRSALRAAAAQHPSVRRTPSALGRVSVLDVEWLTASRAMLLLRLAIDGVGPQDLLVIVDGGEARGSYAFFDTRRHVLAASRSGRYLWAGGAFAVRRDGPRLTVPEAFGPIHAAAWSPDERWLVLGARDAVAFVRPRELGGPRTLVVPLRVSDVAWAPR